MVALISLSTFNEFSNIAYVSLTTSLLQILYSITSTRHKQYKQAILMRHYLFIDQNKEDVEELCGSMSIVHQGTACQTKGENLTDPRV